VIGTRGKKSAQQGRSKEPTSREIGARMVGNVAKLKDLKSLARREALTSKGGRAKFEGRGFKESGDLKGNLFWKRKVKGRKRDYLNRAREKQFELPENAYAIRRVCLRICCSRPKEGERRQRFEEK